MSRRQLLTRILTGVLAGLAFGVIISEATYYFLRDGQARSPQVVHLNIPPGTALKVRNGEPEPSLPSSMTFVVGDVLVVQNADSVSHQLGPLLIPAGSSASLKLDAVESYEAVCSFRPSRYLGLEVQPALTFQTRVLGMLQAGIPMALLFVLYGVFALSPRKAAAS